MNDTSTAFDVVIAGGGPAGTSAAIHLATRGARVLIVEQKTFPRAKLCGEFISPECLSHFERLGVARQMHSCRGASINKTVFYARNGRTVSVPSNWFSEDVALGLSRAEMDLKLLERAKDLGVEVLENAQAAGLIVEGERISGVRVNTNNEQQDYRALVTLDATGRARSLCRYLEVNNHKLSTKTKPRWIAFKAHLENTRVEPGACEIYFYKGGYGGLSSIEHGLSNLCFIVSAKSVRHHGSDPERVVREIVLQNSRASYTLGHAYALTEWLAVSLERFGYRNTVPAEGLLAIGDAAAFIDPFTGSGMLMALESGEVATQAILPHLENLRRGGSFASVTRAYRAQYAGRFDSRLRWARALRSLAFAPRLAEAAISCFSQSEGLRRRAARATRGRRRKIVTENMAAARR